MYLSKYGAGRHIYIPMVKRGVVDHAVGADWTPSAGDVKISKDGGAAANVTNLPSAIAMGNSALWDFSLTATEMQAAQVVITIADSATKAVEDNGFAIETYGNASAQHAVDLSDSVRAGLTALPNAAPGAAGGLLIDDVWTDARAAKLDNLDAAITSRGTGAALDAAGVRAAIGLGAANLDTQLSTIDDFLDTEVAAIKAKTDNLPAAPAAVGDIPSAATIAAAVWASVIEGAITATQMVRGFAAVLMGKASGLNTTTAVYRDLADTKDRITATVDADGNRSAVSRDLS